MSTKKIRIVLVEDHDLTRIGLRTALQQQECVEVVGEAANGQKGIELIESTQPDIAIIDIGLPDMDGIEVTTHLRSKAISEHGSKSANESTYQPKILILTMHDNEESVLAAFAAGADSYSVKDVGIEKLSEAIQSTYEGNSWIDPAIARIVLQQAQQGKAMRNRAASGASDDDSDYEQLLDADPLTDREMEVLELIVDGYSNAAIAGELYITVGTVKTHVRNILSKLCAADRTQAAVRALRTGLVNL
ncbi:MAG: response regulator transcription factor [Elainellaceae cyanobacterium]